MSYTTVDFSCDLHAGVREAYAWLFDMTENPDEQLWPEYLVTVGIAKKLSELKTDWRVIRLEEDVAETVRKALNGRAPNRPPTREQGRIDIVLFDNKGLALPAYAIEVKDVVERCDEAIKDVIRIEELLLLEGPNHSSSLKMGALVLLIRKKNTRAFSDVLHRSAAKFAGNLQKRLDGALTQPHAVRIDWTITTVSDGSVPRIPTDRDWDEEGGPTLSGDEQFTIALIGVFSRV